MNRQNAGNTTDIGPAWALAAENMIIDSSGRLASRMGWVDQSSVAIGGNPQLAVVHELTKADGSAVIVSATNNKLYTGGVGATFTDRTGSLTPTGNDWQFVNFVDKVIGVQASHAPIVSDGSSNFAALGGSPAQLIAICAGFGRLWGVDPDGVTIRYTQLLSETGWSGTGSGSINVRNIFTNGTDRLVGLATFSATLVAFGTKHIIVFTDGRGSSIGLDPTQIYVTDTIENTGLAARDSIQAIGEGDLWFLAKTGVQSLARVIRERNNPMVSITDPIRDYLLTYTNNESSGETKIRSLYSAPFGFYLLILPGFERTFCIDTRQLLQDGSARSTEWTSIGPECGVARKNGDVLFGFDGKIGKYSAYQDNGAAYRAVYLSPHMDFGEDFNTVEKILKRISAVISVATTQSVVIKWGFDFNGPTSSETLTFIGSTGAEYGIGEYGIGEYGGGSVLAKKYVPASGRGQYLQIGIETDINGGAVAIQTAGIFAKAGRMT
jgi:hypothetical protein